MEDGPVAEAAVETDEAEEPEVMEEPQPVQPVQKTVVPVHDEKIEALREKIRRAKGGA